MGLFSRDSLGVWGEMFEQSSFFRSAMSFVESSARFADTGLLFALA